jgi:hypothetical protein
MSKEHHLHSAHEHKAEHKPKEGKILGFEVNTIVLIAVLVIVAAILGTYAGISTGESVVKASINTGASANAVNNAALMSSVEKFVNENFLASQGLTAKVLDVNDQGNGLYELKFDVYQGDKKLDSGVVYSTNGKLIIGNVIDMSKPLPVPAAPTQPADAAPVKSAKPVVDLYVMAFCPYGNQAEDTMLPVFKLLKDKVTFNVHYIVSVSGTTVSSLHGAAEVSQDEREACVLKNYDVSKWFDFATYVNTNCGSNGSCWEAGATTLGIDTAKINTCVTSEGVSLMQANADASTAAGANGSPTLKINGVQSSAVYQYGNSEAYKAAICNSFTTAPSECATALSGSTATTQGGSCAPSQ